MEEIIAVLIRGTDESPELLRDTEGRTWRVVAVDSTSCLVNCVNRSCRFAGLAEWSNGVNASVVITLASEEQTEMIGGQCHLTSEEWIVSNGRWVTLASITPVYVPVIPRQEENGK